MEYHISLSEIILRLPFAMFVGVVLGFFTHMLIKGRQRRKAERLRVQREAWLSKGGFDGD